MLSDVRYGLGAYLGVYLITEHGWTAADIGYAFSFGGLAGLVAQAPLSALVDRIRAKRLVLAVCVVVVTATCLIVPVVPRFWPLAASGVVGALAGTMITPLLAGMSLGIVGHSGFARRACRNEGLFHLGNGLINVLILLSAPVFGSQVLFWAMGLTALASVVATFAVPERAIDHAQARGFVPGAPVLIDRPSALRHVAASRPLLMFALCGALFHLANGAMLGLIAQKLALAHPGQGIALTAASAIAAQAVMVPAAALAARADAWGRKPLLLLAFAALTVRAALYATVSDPAWIIAGQLLDGISAGLLGALYPVVIADLARGARCFAGVQGVVGAMQGLGGLASGIVAGWIVVHAGYDAAFVAFALAATAGGLLFWLTVPETGGGDIPPEVRFAT